MARTVTLAQLVTRARERADMINSGFIATGAGAEDEIYVQQSVAALHSLLVQALPDRYTVRVALVTADTGAPFVNWNVPTDFYKLRKVTYTTSGWTYAIRRLTLDQFIHASNITSSTFPSGYFLESNLVRFAPGLPSATPGPIVYYIAAQPTLVGGGAPVTFDGADGWEEWVTNDVAIKMLAKEESDTRPLLVERNECLTRILAQAPDRDVGEPPKIVDTDAWQWKGWPPVLPPP